MVTGEDRGVAPVIGFILIFSFLVIAFSIYQGAIIPEQNKQAEFQHNERAQGQLLNLQDSIRRTGTTGVSQSVSIQVGADYPDRTLGVNFAVTGGRVSTVQPDPDGANNITFENVQAVRPEVRDYWDSSASTLEFPTKDIVYRPTYTRYNNAPETVLSNTGVFNQFDGANLSIADQILIQGNRITIVAINGSLDESKTGEGATVSVDTEPLSVATSSVTVENNDTSRRINLTVPTTVANEDVWNESSLGEQDTVYDTTVSGNNLTITLEKGTYSLRMAKVGVGSGTVDEGAEYIVPVDPPPRTVFNDTSHEVTVEVRDRFNNPNDSTAVDATVVGSGTIEPANGDSTTDSNGQVTFNYTAPSNGGSATLVFNISDSEARDANARKVVNHSVQVVQSSSGAGNGGSQDFDFISIVTGPSTAVKSGSSNLIIVEVRDDTHDPVGNVDVTANAINTSGSSKNGTFRGTNNRTTRSTNAAGQVVFNYSAPESFEKVPIGIDFTIGDGVDRNRTSIQFNVTRSGSASGGGSGGGGGSDSINPSGSSDIRLIDERTGGQGNNVLITEFENSGANVTIKQARLNFFLSSQGGSGLDYMNITADSNTAPVSAQIFNRGDFQNLAPEVELPGEKAADNTTNVRLKWYQSDGSTRQVRTDKGEFFVLTLVFSNGESETYFVAP